VDQNYLRAETLTAANARLIGYQAAIPDRGALGWWACRQRGWAATTPMILAVTPARTE
jgi:hypothetical protein